LRYNISAIINFHSEGKLAEKTIRSVEAAISEAKHFRGLNCEVILILDKASSDTKENILQFSNYPDFKILNVDYGDLALSRNHGVEVSDSDYIAFLDGDDMWGKEWLWRAFDADQNILETETVWHPEVNIFFGKEQMMFIHTDMDSKEFVLDYLRISNYWTALSFGKASIFKELPFKENRLDKGFGFEDWNWNCRVIEKGIKHKIVENTCHFIRTKESGSLLEKTNAMNCIVTPHGLFK